MQYKRFSDTIALRLDPGDEIIACLLELARQEDIQLADVTGLGAVSDFTAGVFRLSAKQFAANDYHGEFEITALSGTITSMDQKPYVHLHMGASGPDGAVVGGHLSRAVISATGELLVRVVDGALERRFDLDLGLNLFEF